jgi:hypothetical protein
VVVAHGDFEEETKSEELHLQSIHERPPKEEVTGVFTIPHISSIPDISSEVKNENSR